MFTHYFIISTYSESMTWVPLSVDILYYTNARMEMFLSLHYDMKSSKPQIVHGHFVVESVKTFSTLKSQSIIYSTFL